MSIQTSDPPGQQTEQVLQQLLTLLKRGMSQPAAPKQQWRFKQPERSAKTDAALRAYWGEVYKDEITALDAEWAVKREPTPITTDTPEAIRGSQTTDAA